MPSRPLPQANIGYRLWPADTWLLTQKQKVYKNMTHGSTLASVVRYIKTPDGIEKVASEEWPIIPAEKAKSQPQATFSKKGDSESCV